MRPLVGCMACRSGCPTQDHASYAECCRNVNFGLWYSQGVQRENDWNSELKEYRDARAQGIQPATTKRADIRAATELSQLADKPFNAETGGFNG